MKRVISVNLDGTAVALDEDAYERLRAYITLAQARLGPNPDQAEIVADLERAIAARLRTERVEPEAGSISDALMEKTLADVGTVERVDAMGTAPNGPALNTVPRSYAAMEPESDFTRLPVFLLCLFVGWLGVHRFFVGKVGTGVLQLLTLGGLTIWSLIDLILILCGEFRDKEGRKIRRWT